MAMSMTPVAKKSVVTKMDRQMSVSSSSGSALLGSGASTSSSRGTTDPPPAAITQHTTSPCASTCASDGAARHQQCDHPPIAGGAFSVKRASSMRATTPRGSDHGGRSMIGRSARDASAKLEVTSQRAGPMRDSENQSTPSRIDVPFSRDSTVDTGSRALLRKVFSKAESSAPLKRKLIADEAIDSTVQGASDILAGAPPKPRTKTLALTASACHSTQRSQTRSAERRRSLSSGVRATGPALSLLSHGAKRMSSRHVASTSIFPEPTSTPSRLSRAPSMSLQASTAQRSAIPLSSTRMVKKGSGLSGISSIGEGIKEEPTDRRTMTASSETTSAQSIIPPAPSTTQSARRKKDYALSLKPKMGSPAQQFLPNASVPHFLRSHSGSNRSASTAASFRSASGDISQSTTRPARQRQRPRDSWETVPVSSRRTSFAPSIAPQERTSSLASKMPAPCPSSAHALLKLSIGPPESIAGDISWESIAQDRPTPAFDIDSNHTPSRFDDASRLNNSDGLPYRSAISYASPDHEAKLQAALRGIAPTSAKPDGTEGDPTLGSIRGAYRAVGRGSTTLEEMLRTTLLTASRSHANAVPDRDTWLIDGSVGETMRADLNNATVSSTPLQLSLNQIVRDPSAVAILRDDFDRTYARAQDLEFVVAQQARELEDLRTTEAAQRTRAEALGREGDASTMRLDAMAKVIDELERELEQARSAEARTTGYLAPSDTAAANGKIIAEAVNAISMIKHVADAFAHLNQVAELQREDVGDQMRALEVMKWGFELMTPTWA
ncbi:BZ3500_MvSof-1268-A1-R1_Chr2-2g05057 [Microbotryum saponariae]|uniref:BZ3500_MvSof-1268-A1-R1_Chr2-2g05057 protein n=1 Tax=Microbotryum saponariae TaxID=289078 RepID=A0A2X0L2L3_9BASI|nr:BZ3500_MvSof-1268-A1-R1_Chr2-2g05057 [Microbotryum saponariae]SDA00801.1 BZ3501_MvSof-1269-A2-R1_Chr2-2g04731 [Microbotryum saponariae]